MAIYVCVNNSEHRYTQNTTDGFCTEKECYGIGYLVLDTQIWKCLQCGKLNIEEHSICEHCGDTPFHNQIVTENPSKKNIETITFKTSFTPRSSFLRQCGDVIAQNFPVVIAGIAVLIWKTLGFIFKIMGLFITEVLRPVFTAIFTFLFACLSSVGTAIVQNFPAIIAFIAVLFGRIIVFLLKIVAIFAVGVTVIILLAIVMNVLNRDGQPVRKKQNPTITSEQGKSQERSTTISKPTPAKPSQIHGRYPEVSMRSLKSSDLNGKSAWELRIMRNEIFARYGYIFQDGKIKDYFVQQSWYIPKYNDVSSMLTEIERKNIQLIQQYEKKLQ